MSSGALAIVVLAGDRGPGDPLAAAAGVPGKVLVPVAGRAMLLRVLDAAGGLDADPPIRLVRPDHAAYGAALTGSPETRRIEPAAGPAASVSAAMADIDVGRPVLVLTGDHPLLTADRLRRFIDQAAATGADAVVGLADADAVQARFPEGRRTRYRFADRRVCGTNLFLVRTAAGRRLIAQWQAFERDRKRPWRIIRRLGVINLIRYLRRRLTVDDAFAALSKRLGVTAAPVLVDWPEAAVDVDTPDDLALVERVFAEQAAADGASR
ncbi:NTP transferase domain-containing protein [Halomonas denitrificans]|nr:NTP transferase domain-containing protein [Halomonas denitrificans]